MTSATRPRSRATITVLLLATIAIGCLSRALTALHIPKYFGDVLWAVMFFEIVLLLRPTMTRFTAAAWTWGICAVIEFSKLWHVALLDDLRQTRAGGLILGTFSSGKTLSVTRRECCWPFCSIGW